MRTTTTIALTLATGLVLHTLSVWAQVAGGAARGAAVGAVGGAIAGDAGKGAAAGAAAGGTAGAIRLSFQETPSVPESIDVSGHADVA